MNHRAEARRQTLVARVLQRCRTSDDTYNGVPCQIWTGPTGGGRNGLYGRMSVDGRTVAVHRVVATHAWGYLPATTQVDHQCGRTLCAEERHLEPVSHKENQRRKTKRRRPA